MPHSYISPLLPLTMCVYTCEAQVNCIAKSVLFVALWLLSACQLPPLKSVCCYIPVSGVQDWPCCTGGIRCSVSWHWAPLVVWSVVVLYLQLSTPVVGWSIGGTCAGTFVSQRSVDTKNVPPLLAVCLLKGMAGRLTAILRHILPLTGRSQIVKWQLCIYV